MKWYLAAGALLILIIVGSASFFLKKPAPLPTPPGTQFPAGGTEPVGAGFMQVAGDGGAVTTVDFLTNGTATEDPANPGNYYLAGSSDYCPIDQVCPPNDSDFNIVYFGEDHSFVIALLREPLGEVRKKAEAYLMTKLGLTKEGMCKLKYSLMTDSYTSATYGGQNLGFSFCPGAVKLP